MYPPKSKFSLTNKNSPAPSRGRARSGLKNARPTIPHARIEEVHWLLLNNHPESGNFNLVAWTLRRRRKQSVLHSGEQNQKLVLFALKCPVHPCAVVQNTFCTVEITDLQAVYWRRTSLHISLFHDDVDLRVDNNVHDKQTRVPQGIENNGLAPHEMVDGG
jgi:hypothetical protein